MDIYNIEISYLYNGIKIILSRFQFISYKVLLSLCILFITTASAHWLMFVLQGINLDQLRLEKDDVVIKIGKSECNITSTGRQLTCRPPREPPSPMKSGRYPEVEVSHTVGSVNGPLGTGRSLTIKCVFYIFIVDLKCLYIFCHISEIILGVVYHQVFIQYTMSFIILLVL